MLGGTAWLWAREDFAGAVDVLFVDEAGQMSLANVLAVSQAAEQPRAARRSAAARPAGEGAVIRTASACRRLSSARRRTDDAAGSRHLPADHLAPVAGATAFTSELFYEGKLDRESRPRAPGAARRGRVRRRRGCGSCPCAHDGNQSASDEEVDAVAAPGRTPAGARLAVDRRATAPLASSQPTTSGSSRPSTRR